LPWMNDWSHFGCCLTGVTHVQLFHVTAQRVHELAFDRPVNEKS